jgi:uncharacterized membrane protein YbaN (DUF454 family)
VRLTRPLYLLVGLASVGLGMVGVVVPGLPTTVFLLIALWCFAKASPRMERWLRTHAVLGPFIHNWEQERAVPRSAKVLAGTTMLASVLLAWLGFGIPGWAVVLMSVTLGAVFGYIVTRPEPTGAAPGTPTATPTNPEPATAES